MSEQPNTPELAGHRLGVMHFGGVGLILLTAVGAFVFWRTQTATLAQARTERASIVAQGPRVQAVDAVLGPTERSVTLLADVRPYQTATLYAKVSGYLKAMRVDRGDAVKAGQVLAEIESIETDNQFAAAQADLKNKRGIAQRQRDLMARGTISTKVIEQAEADERVSQANVNQLEAIKSYETVRAPFDGTVVARFADLGALIQNAATNQTSSLPVLTIADNSRLRVAVYVSQVDVPMVRVGAPVEVVDAADPSRRIKAVISRSASMLDPTTRTLMAEIDVDNVEGFLVPGSFAYVTLKAPVKSFVRIPATALLMRNNERMVAVVDKSNVVRLRKVQVAGTDGARIDLSDGLQPGERVAISIPDEVTDGSQIQPIVVASRAN